MNKALMISIRPEHAYNIITGKKTIELRKWIPKDYKGWVYVYVTKTIRNYKLSYYYQPKTHNDNIYRLHGNIPFRFWFDEYTNYSYHVLMNGETEFEEAFDNVDLVEKSCLSFDEIDKYTNFGQKKLYAWHIKKLEIFDEPKYLSEFYKFKKKWIYSGMDCPPYVDEVETRLSKAPQRSVWVYTKELEK
jgi:predicted transcriptional regulator